MCPVQCVPYLSGRALTFWPAAAGARRFPQGTQADHTTPTILPIVGLRLGPQHLHATCDTRFQGMCIHVHLCALSGGVKGQLGQSSSRTLQTAADAPRPDRHRRARLAVETTYSQCQSHNVKAANDSIEQIRNKCNEIVNGAYNEISDLTVQLAAVSEKAASLEKNQWFCIGRVRGV